MKKSFNNILKEKRENIGMTQEDLGSFVGVDDRTIGLWERGVSEPKADHVVMLADIFRCSVDELVGREFPTDYEESEETIGKPFYKNVQTLRAKRGFYTIMPLAIAAGVSASGIRKWEFGCAYPQLKRLIRLADGLRCPLDELLGRGPKKRNHTYYS